MNLSILIVIMEQLCVDQSILMELHVEVWMKVVDHEQVHACFSTHALGPLAGRCLHSLLCTSYLLEFAHQANVLRQLPT